jgi:hypothetical protein
MAEANQLLVKELREALALAEAGTITDGLVVGIGGKTAHHTFAARTPEALVSVLGEAAICVAGLQNMVMHQRTVEANDRASGIIRKPS